MSGDVERADDDGLLGKPNDTLASLVLRYASGAMRFLFSTNHQDVGTMFLAFTMVAGIIGGLLPYFLNITLLFTDVPIAGSAHSSLLVTGHGLITVCFAALPAMLGGLGNWFVPAMIGAREMAFPRMNNATFWLLLLSFALLVTALAAEPSSLDQGADAAYSSSVLANDLAIAALYIEGGAMILISINFITTIFNMRGAGMALHAMPLFVWAILVTAFLLILWLPVVAGTVTALLANQSAGTVSIEPADGAILYGDLYWFLTYPQTYLVVVPGFGLVSEIVSTFSGRKIIGYRGIVYTMVGIGFLGFVVWADYLYSSNLAVDVAIPSILLALVFGTLMVANMFSWAATAWSGVLSFRVPMLWATAYIFILVAGGAACLVLATTGADAASNHVIPYLHYVIGLGTICAIFGGCYYGLPIVSGVMFNEAIAKPHFWVTLVAITLLALPELSGTSASPNGSDNLFTPFTGSGDIAKIGAYTLAASLVVFFTGVMEALVKKRLARPDPWGSPEARLVSRF